MQQERSSGEERPVRSPQHGCRQEGLLRSLGGEWAELGTSETPKKRWSVPSIGKDTGREGPGGHYGLEGPAHITHR